MTSSDRSRFVYGLLLIFTLSLTLRLAYIGIRYDEDIDVFQAGDYTLYRIGGEHIRDIGNLSNSLFLLRPPLFSLLIAALGVDDLAVLLVNASLGALLASLTVVLGRQLRVRPTLALLAGGIVALDPASIGYASFLGPEPLANLFLLLMVVALLAVFTRPQARYGIAWGAAAGVALTLSTLARPAAFLIWTGLSVWLLLVDRRRWRTVAAYALVSAIGVGAWIAHNERAFDNPTVSSVSAYSLLYYRAASVEHWATGHEMDTVYTDLARRVEARLGHDTTTVDTGTRHTHYAGPASLTNAMNAVAFETFTDHPLEYLYTLPIGVGRMFGFTNRLPAWTRPIEIAWNAALVIGTATGLWIAARERRWLLFWVVLLPAAYFTGGTLFAQTSGLDTRMRTMFTPHMAVACTLALDALRARWTRSRAPAAPSIRAAA